MFVTDILVLMQWYPDFFLLFRYDDDFFRFRRIIRDCQRRLGDLICERIQVG